MFRPGTVQAVEPGWATVWFDHGPCLRMRWRRLFTPVDNPLDSRRYLCPHCGHRVPALNPHQIDAAKVDILAEMAAMNLRGVDWVKFQRDQRLVQDPERTLVRDAVHAERLYWHGLADYRAQRSGEYRANLAGMQFLCGVRWHPLSVYCRGGRAVLRCLAEARVHEVENIVLDRDYWDHYGRLQGWISDPQ